MFKAMHAEGREERTQKDSVKLENELGAEVWRIIVRGSMQELAHIDASKDDRIFFKNPGNALANHFSSVIVSLNVYFGGCGGWELIDRHVV